MQATTAGTRPLHVSLNDGTDGTDGGVSHIVPVLPHHDDSQAKAVRKSEGPEPTTALRRT